MLLGQLLVQAGLVTPAQVDAALTSQVVSGGRLGTNLVEAGAIDLDALTRVLAAQRGVPPALQAHFEKIVLATLQLVPVDLARRHLAVPLGIARGQRILAVAFVDPDRPEAVAEIAAATGMTVQPAVGAELRVRYYLERAYGVARGHRHVRVEPPPPAAPAPPPGATARRYVQPNPPVAAPAPPPAAAPAPPPAAPPLDAEPAIAAIRAAGTRDEIGEAVTRFLRSAFGCGLVLSVRDGMALGWTGFAPGVDAATLEAIAIPLGVPTIFGAAVERRTTVQGPPPPEGAVLQDRLWKMLRCAPPSEAIVLPILLNDRVVSLVYAHGVDGGLLRRQAVQDLVAVCSAMASALVALIQRARSRR